MEPELVIKSAPIDFELADLLGKGSRDYVILCADGVQLEFFGTPSDSATYRRLYQEIADDLNNRRRKSWAKFFGDWKPYFIKQFQLANDVTAKDYHPRFSIKISRVCHGYSQYLHCAIGLFDDLADRIDTWKVGKLGGKGTSFASILTKSGESFYEEDPILSLAIAIAVKRLLIAEKINA